MRLPAACLIVLALLAPTALAGTERDPEIRDPADVADAAADVLAAWLRAEPGGVRLHVKVADARESAAIRDHVWWVYFVVHETDVPASGTIGFADDGALRGHLGSGPSGGLAGRDWRSGGFEAVANGVATDLRSDRGRPAVFSALVPWGSVPGLEPGATLVDLAAGSAFYDRAARQWRGGVDRASSDAEFVATPEPKLLSLTRDTFPILVPAWVIPLIVLTCVGLGLTAGWLGARKSARRAAPASAPVAVPIDTGRPPGARFQRAPTRGRGRE